MSNEALELVNGDGSSHGRSRRVDAMPRVLVVGNNEERASLLVKTVCGAEDEFEASWVPSRSATAESFVDERADCVLLDDLLPDAAGLDVLRSIRRQLAGVPIIVMTTVQSESLSVWMREAGAADYVVKHGAFLTRMIEAVRKVIAHRAVEGATTRLTQGVFVGRSPELEALHAGVDDLLNGRGGIFLLEGQAGIGKTALTRRVAAYAATRRARVVWGRCHETGEAPAYWPWIQIVRECVGDGAVDDLWAGLPSDAKAVADAALGATNRLDALLLSQVAEDEQGRFRLFDRIVLYLKGIARQQPTLIALDDFQWTDRSSLLLLQFLARELGDSRLLVLCGYRDGELAMDAAAARVVAEMRREATTLSLRGLSEEEVRALVRAVAGQRRQEACACVPAIFRRTDGNPLFVEEVLRHMLDEGIVYHNGESWTSRVAPEEIRLPDTIREIAERRLRHFSQDCRELLSVASVVGREFGVEAIAHLTDQPEVTLCAVLDEALKRRIVEPVPGPVGVYRFCHGAVRETLYEELSTVRRAELHDRFGEYLERLRVAEIDLYAAELVYHFLRSARPQSVRKAADYALRAARRAHRLMAHEEAARHYELAQRALQVTRSGECRERGELLSRAAESWWRASEPELARRAAFQAAEILRAAGSVDDFARAALTYAGRTPGLGNMVCDETIVRMLEEALALLGEGDSGIRACILGRLAEEVTFSGDRERRRALGKQAIEMARRLGEPAILAAVLESMHWALWLPENFERRLPLADEFVRSATASRDDAMRFDAHLLRAFARLEMADVRAAERDFSACSRIAAALKQPYTSWTAATAEVCRAFALGRLHDVEALVERAFELGEKVQAPHASLFRGVQLAHLCWLQGRFTELTLLWQNLHEEQPLLLPALECAFVLTRCEQGRFEEARSRFEHLAAGDFGSLPRDLARVQNLIFLAQACSYLRDAPRAAVLYELLQPLEGRVVVFAPALLWGAASHFLGLLAATMGRTDLARRHFEEALATNARIGSKQWLARSQLAYAELLLDSDTETDRARAEDLLGECLQTSEILDMASVLDQTRALLARGTRRGRSERKEQDDGAGRAAAITHGSVNVFRREGGHWTIVYGEERLTLRDMRGLNLLAILLGEPGREFFVGGLVAMVEPIDPDLIGKTPRSIGEPGTMTVESDLGPILDDRAKREFAAEIASLEDQIEEAESFNDTAKAGLLRERLEELLDRITEDIGIGRGGRPVGDRIERMRQKVRKNIKAAFDAIAKVSPALASHLNTHVKTGRFCSYVADREHPIRWTT